MSQSLRDKAYPSLLKDLLGAKKVIVWNSVLRRNDVDKEVLVEKQKGPEDLKKKLEEVVQPPAGVAHVDQDKVWGQKLCEMAAGDDFASATRSSIVNLWRPLKGLFSFEIELMSRSCHQCPFDHGGLPNDLARQHGRTWSSVRFRHESPL